MILNKYKLFLLLWGNEHLKSPCVKIILTNLLELNLKTHRKRPNGFTIIELMIALLIMSSLGLGVANFMRRSTANLKSGSISDEMQTRATLVNKLLKNDISQAVYLNVSCAGNPANGSATVSCSDIKVRGGITPLPGMNKDDVNGLSGFGLPANLTANSSSLPEINDGIRILQFDLSSSYNCRLYANHIGAANPSITAGNGLLSKMVMKNTLSSRKDKKEVS